MDSPTYLGQPRSQQRVLLPAHSTRFRPLWDPSLYAGTKGSKIFAVSITSTDGAANTVKLAIGKPVTLQANMGVGAIVDGGGGSDEISRTSGSFVTDGWNVGDPLLVNGATTLANDFKALLTSVAALTLSFATATAAAAENLPTGAKLFRPVQLGIIDVPANSGHDAAAVAVSGLNATEMPILNAKPNDFIVLGADDVLFAAVGTALGAGETVEITAFGSDY